MITLTQFSMQEILLLMQANAAKANLAGFAVKVNTLRLQCLKRSQICCQCGLQGNIWLLQQHAKESPHLNLYHKDFENNFTLMTQDHIKPKSKGGLDRLDNLQTMCTNCNFVKNSKY